MRNKPAAVIALAFAIALTAPAIPIFRSADASPPIRPPSQTTASCVATWTNIVGNYPSAAAWNVGSGAPEPNIFSLSSGCTYDTQTPSNTPLIFPPAPPNAPTATLSGATISVYHNDVPGNKPNGEHTHRQASGSRRHAHNHLLLHPKRQPARRNRHAHRDGNSDIDIYTHRDCHAYRHGYGNRNADGYTYRYAHCHGNGYTYIDRNRHAHSNANRNRYANAHSYA